MRSVFGCFLSVLLSLALMPGSLQAQLLRRPDNRTKVDINRAKALGIEQYQSQRLILYSDTEPDRARKVLDLVDQLFPIWERQLGVIPNSRDGRPFQITGYLMKDRMKFTQAGLVRPRLEKIVHGQHLGYEFWMDDVDADYYRGHLLLHESSHCVMQCLDDRLKPVWYLEGMAEYFGTHVQDGQAWKFGVVPASRQSSLGFGRIEMIREEVAAGRGLTAAEVMQLGTREFSESRSTPYAWSWGLCTFLANHPRYAEEFRAVCGNWETAPFRTALDQFWQEHEKTIEPEWEIFRDSLGYGWDLERGGCVFEVKAVELVENRHELSLSIDADRGWQSTGLKVRVGQSLKISAKGRVVLGRTTKPWESEPQGISIRYSEGRPIGRLLGAVLRDVPASEGSTRYWEMFEIGPMTTYEVKSDGVLFLRVNDRWNELMDNSGGYQVTISR